MEKKWSRVNLLYSGRSRSGSEDDSKGSEGEGNVKRAGERRKDNGNLRKSDVLKVRPFELFKSREKCVERNRRKAERMKELEEAELEVTCLPDVLF